MSYSIKGGKNSLVISDTQFPFEHRRALAFCAYLKRHFGIKDDDIYHVGDELDQNWAGLYKKDPDAFHTANSEIAHALASVQEWATVFPKMMLATSNHGERVAKLAFEAGIPSIMMRRYQEVIRAPSTWRWAPYWTSNTKYKFRVEHGDKRGLGNKPHIALSLRNGMSTIIGHYHTKAVVERIETEEKSFFGAVAGCLIDRPSYAFKYSLKDAELAKIGAVVVLDNGRWAQWIPL